MDERREFSVTEHDESDGSVRVIGELDAAEAPNLQEVLRRLEGEGSDVLLDLWGLPFMDVFGLHLIEEAADAARQGGFGLRSPGRWRWPCVRCSWRRAQRSICRALRPGWWRQPRDSRCTATLARWSASSSRTLARPVRSGYGPDVGRS